VTKSEPTHISSIRSLRYRALSVEAAQVEFTVSRTYRAEATFRLTNATPRALASVPLVTEFQVLPVLLTETV
jgi:hypothetical protein